MKSILFLWAACLLMMSFPALAQKVELKKGKVILDKQERFQFERRLFNSEFVLRTLEEGDELLSIIRNDNGTDHYWEDDFIQIVFPASQVSLISYRLKDLSYARLLNMIVRDQVIGKDGSIDEEKLRVFFLKYDDNPAPTFMAY